MIRYGVYQDKTDRRGKAAHNSEAANHDGIFEHIGEKFRVKPDPNGKGLAVLVGSGKAKFDGTWTLSNEPLPLSLPAADPARARIDTVVLEIGRSLLGRRNRILLVPGKPAEAPAGAPLKETGKTHQYPLAEIRVEPGAIALREQDIQSLVGTPKCPYTTDIRFRSTFQGTSHANDPACVEEILQIAKSYFDVRGTKEKPTFVYNQSDPACFDRGFDPANASLRRNIDCSTYIGLLLRGIPFEKSPYQSLTEDPALIPPKPGMTAPNLEEYSWAVDPAAVKLSVNPDETPRPIRTASQLAEWMEKQNLAIPLQPDLSNVEPGDIIFWAKTRPNGEFLRPRRYRKISHVAICYSKLPQPETVTCSDLRGIRKLDLDAELVLKNILRLIERGDLPASVKDHGGAGTGDYRVQYQNGVWTIARAPDKGQEPAAPVQLADPAAFGVRLERDPEAAACSFSLEVYYWNKKYPYKHTMMEVTTKPPYVLNNTLEKSRPGNLVLVCRPRLFPADHA